MGIGEVAKWLGHPAHLASCLLMACLGETPKPLHSTGVSPVRRVR